MRNFFQSQQRNTPVFKEIVKSAGFRASQAPPFLFKFSGLVWAKAFLFHHIEPILKAIVETPHPPFESYLASISPALSQAFLYKFHRGLGMPFEMIL